MLRNLSYKRKQILMGVSAMVLLYIAYQLSFEKALNALYLNRQLRKDVAFNIEQPSSFMQIEKENEFYKSVIKGYNVKKQDRESRLWQSISGMAIANKVEISFVDEKEILTDTTTISRGIISDQFTFSGKYHHLVNLLDTVSKSNGIGQIYSLSLSVKKLPQQNDKQGKLTLVMRIKGIEQ